MGCRISAPLDYDGMGGNRREALCALSNYDQPITLQVEGWRWRGHHTSDCGTQTERSWDRFRGTGITTGSSSRLQAFMDRPCCNHVSLPHHYRGCEYLSSIPRDVERISSLGFQDRGLSSSTPKDHGCLFGCCGTNTDEPDGFLSQTEDEDPVPLSYLPLLHELDSGLGCTDGSYHQGELSGPETEEGLELGSPRYRTTPGSTPSSQSLISSELSDSGFYSVSAGDFHHFQRLLERKMRLYRANAGEDSQERLPACLDLQSIPEASPPPRDLASLQFRRAGSARFNRFPSGSLLLPQPGPSTCSTPSCLRRAAFQQRNASLEFLSSSLRHLDRRRASHPAASHYRASTHEQWQPVPDLLHTPAEQHLPLPRNPCCSDVGLDSEVLDGQEMAGCDQERQERRDDQYLMLSSPQDAMETWSNPASGPYDRLSPSEGPYSMPVPEGPGKPRVGRSQLLRARALKLADERSENTTDEEACEVQTGRYCSKAERRRHLLLAQEQRQRKRDGAYQRGVAGCNAVLEMSHRKLSRLRNEELLDDWTTVQELLTHGTRDMLRSAPLLSVTTV